MKKYRSFRQWFENEAWDEIPLISQHGASQSSFTYYHTASQIFDTYDNDIWDYLYEIADNQGYKTIIDMIHQMKNVSGELEDINGFKSLLLWTAMEAMAFEYYDGDEFISDKIT